MTEYWVELRVSEVPRNLAFYAISGMFAFSDACSYSPHGAFISIQGKGHTKMVRLLVLSGSLLSVFCFQGFSQITDKVNVDLAVLIHSSQTDEIGLAGELSATAALGNGFQTELDIKSKDQKVARIDQAYLRWIDGNQSYSLGFGSDDRGLKVHISGGAKERVPTKESVGLLKELAFASKEFQLGWFLDYQKKTQPLSASLQLTYEQDRLLPGLTSSLAWHLGKRDRVAGLEFQLLPLWLNYPSLGNRLDVHGVGSVFAADVEGDLAWSVEVVMGSVPDPFPWSAATQSQEPLAWFGSISASVGLLLPAGDWSIEPGLRVSGTSKSLFAQPQPSLKGLLGANLQVEKGVLVWVWSGTVASKGTGRFAPLWDVGLKMET